MKDSEFEELKRWPMWQTQKLNGDEAADLVQA